MKISIDWLKEYIDFDQSAQEIDHILTMGGLEVEGIENFEPIEGGLAGLVIGEVVECGKHPDADKLSLTKVDIGEAELLPIVCGAPNVAQGQKVVVATVGATLYPTEGEPFKIKKGKIRGEVSMGMICAEDEIGLGKSHAGIMVLETELPNGTPAAEYFDLDATEVVEIGLTPNRVDAASHYGVARDLKVLLGKELRFPSTEAFKVANTNRTIAVEVADTEACPRYAGLTISGLTVAPSPEWLQNRLKSIGLAPINNVVDATNYILHALGQPLHAFDADEIKGDKIIVKLANEGEKFVTLDEVERTLTATDLMICNAEAPMCIAGVFGGLHSGVTEKTTSIFLESAYFSPDFVRKTSQKHAIKTDSSFRFERGTDPNIPVEALKVAALLIQEVAGGEVSSEIVDTHTERFPDFEVKAKYKNIDRLIGKHIPKEEVRCILEGLEMTFLSDSEEEFVVSVPPYRVDVQREADIVEEILRIIGFNSVELSEDMHSDFLAHFPKKDKEVLQAKVTEMLAGAGMNEIMTNSLTTHAYTDAVESLDSAKNVEILNVLSADLDVMRQTLMFSSLEVVNHNVNRRQTNLKMFEFGKIYRKEAEGYEEDAKLSLVVTGDVAEESWRAASTKTSFYDLQKLVSFIFQKLNIKDIEQEASEDDRFAYALSLNKKGRHLGVIGKVAPKVAKVVGVKQEVFYAELDWTNIVELYSADYVFSEIPKYPEVRRDLSLVMNANMKFAKVKELAFHTERKLLKRINVFDIYEGEHLEEGKKSYSVSFILQDTQKTLNDKAIDKVMSRLMDVFEKELNILIRK